MEFALVLPVTLILLLGMVDLGRAFVFGVSVQQGTREAARLGSKAALDTTITDATILQRLVAASDPALVGCAAVTTSQSCGGGTWTFMLAFTPSRTGGSTVEVKAVGNVSLLVGFLTGAMGLGLNQVTVQGDAAMVVM